MNTDDEAKIAGAVGGVAGAAGSVATATIGSVVGGGMATGLVITAAAPVIIGATAYGLYKWLKD
jgi:hypothetical protein